MQIRSVLRLLCAAWTGARRCRCRVVCEHRESSRDTRFQAKLVLEWVRYWYRRGDRFGHTESNIAALPRLLKDRSVPSCEDNSSEIHRQSEDKDCGYRPLFRSAVVDHEFPASPHMRESRVSTLFHCTFFFESQTSHFDIL